MDNNLVSIIMVCYNHALYLKQSIESVISQTYEDWELVIVDDGSQDNSLEIAENYVKAFPDKIRLCTHPDRKNLGISVSYKLGLRYCRGEFIGFLEPDDFWLDNNLKLKVEILLKQDVSLVYSDVVAIGDAEVIKMREVSLRHILPLPARQPFKAFPKILVMNIVFTFSTVVIKKVLLQDLKFISNRKYEMWLDWFLWIQASLRTKFFFLPEKLVCWKLYKESFYNKFLLRQGIINIIIFDVKYRLILAREIILSQKIYIRKKIAMLYLFFVSFLKRVLFFINDKINWQKK